MRGGLWKCRIKATGEIKVLRTYDFGYVDAAGNSYAKVHVVKLEKIDENN